MKISAKAEYACLAVLALARKSAEDPPVRIREISAAHGIPERYLVQILLQLKGAGLVMSTRGAAGGYRLARPAASISLGEVLTAIDGPESGIKVATERYENTVHPDAVPRDVSDESVAEMYSADIAPRFPDVSSRCLRTTTCLYTVTPDAKFVIDYADENRNVLFASACSGHGFKHSPAVGEALAQRALGLNTTIDLSGFTLERLARPRM